MIQPTFPDSRRIKQWHGTFLQTGTSNPLLTQLHNTIGGTLTAARTTLGVYTITGTGLFTLNKTIILGWGGIDNGGRNLINPSGGTANVFVTMEPETDENTITIKTYTATNTNTPREYSDTTGHMLLIIYVYE